MEQKPPEGTEQKPTTEQKPGAANTPDPIAVARQEAADAKAALEKLQAKLSASEKQANEEKLKAEGKVNELLEQTKAELAAAQALAGIGKSYVERETKRITDAKAKLTERQQGLIDNALKTGGIELAAAFLDEITANTQQGAKGDGKTSTEKPPANQGGSAGANAIDFSAARKGGRDTWEEAKKRDPEGAQKWLIEASNKPLNGSQRPLAHLPVPSLPVKQ